MAGQLSDEEIVNFDKASLQTFAQEHFETPDIPYGTSHRQLPADVTARSDRRPDPLDRSQFRHSSVPNAEATSDWDPALELVLPSASEFVLEAQLHSSLWPSL